MVVLTIQFDEATGQMSLNGPINNQILCFGLLELAKGVIIDVARQNQNKIVPAVFGALPPPPGAGS